MYNTRINTPQRLFVLTLTFCFISSLYVEAQDIIQLTDYQAIDLSSNPRELTKYQDGIVMRIDDGSILFLDPSSGDYISLYNEATGNKLWGGNIDDDNGIYPVIYDNRLFITAEDPQMGAGLWVYDGNETNLVASIQSSHFGNDYAVGAKIVYNNQLYAMLSPDPMIGLELYAIDQNLNVTLTADLTNGNEYFDNFIIYNNQLLFTYDDDTIGEEWWQITDDKAPEIVTDISTGSSSSSPADPSIVNGILLFSARRLSEGRELWGYDGTSVGIIKDLAIGTGSGDPTLLTVVGDDMYFASDDNLYITDGTESGTVMIQSFDRLDDFTAFQNKLIFSDRSEIWSSDGTVAGTAELYAITTLASIRVTSEYIYLFSSSFNGRIYQSQGKANDQKLLTSNDDFEIRSSVKTWVIDNTIYFEAITPEEGNELWQLEESGEIRLTANITTKTGGLASNILTDDEYIYYMYDAILWRTDGTKVGAEIVKNMSGQYVDYKLHTIMNGDIFLSARIPEALSNFEYVLLKLNHTTGVLTVVDIFDDPLDDTKPVVVGDRFYFLENGNVYETTGEAGSSTIFDNGDGAFGNYFVWDGDLYHSYEDFSHPTANQLHKNGEMIYDFGGRTSAYGNPSNFIVFNNELYFSAFTPDTGRELWKTDGTPEGTKIVVDFNTTNGSNVGFPIAATDDYLIYQTRDDTNYYLMKSDGTAGGTEVISSAVFYSNPIAFDGKVYFSGSSLSLFEPELWVTDGSTEGTQLFKDIDPGSSSSIPLDFFQIGDILYFSANDGSNGRELWKTDGTEVNTTMVSDIWTGFEWSAPRNLAAFKGSLIFMAETELTEPELFILNDCNTTGLLPCTTIPCDLTSMLFRSDAIIDIQTTTKVLSDSHVTLTSDVGLSIPAQLTIEAGGSLNMYVAGCDE